MACCWWKAGLNGAHLPHYTTTTAAACYDEEEEGGAVATFTRHSRRCACLNEFLKTNKRRFPRWLSDSRRFRGSENGQVNEHKCLEGAKPRVLTPALISPYYVHRKEKEGEKKTQQVQKVLVCERGVTMLERKHGGSRRMAPTGAAAAVPVAWRTCPPPTFHLFIYLFFNSVRHHTDRVSSRYAHWCLTNAFCVTNTQRANMSHVLTPPFTKFPCRRWRQTWERRHPDFSSDDGPDSSIKTQIWWIIDVKRADFSDLCRLERV